MRDIKNIEAAKDFKPITIVKSIALNKNKGKLKLPPASLYQISNLAEDTNSELKTLFSDFYVDPFLKRTFYIFK